MAVGGVPRGVLAAVRSRQEERARTQREADVEELKSEMGRLLVSSDGVAHEVASMVHRLEAHEESGRGLQEDMDALQTLTQTLSSPAPTEQLIVHRMLTP